MAENIERQIQLLLNGESIDDDTITRDICQSIDTKKNKSPGAVYVPICQKTVTYIVAAIVLNDQDEVLMIQEAKASCSGKWYLPAGRVERNENLVDAVKREVLEETGFIVQPSSVILVECASGSWFRFVFIADIVGGNLKTPDQANEESLQACWVRNVNDLLLRANDIIPLIERGRDYTKNKTVPQHPYILPVSKSFSKLLLRLIITAKKRATNRLHILISNTEPFVLPICEINPNRSLLSTLHNFMTEIFGTEVPQHKPHGLFSIEFSGDQDGDGLCLSLLVSFKLPLENVQIIGDYVWHELSHNLEKTITIRLPRNMTVPLNVVR